MSSNYRRSGYGYDDYYAGGGGGGGQRWDRDRFERMSRSRGGSESFRYEEDDRYYAGGGDDRKVRVEFEQDRRDPYTDRYYDNDRFSTPRRSRPEYIEQDRFRVSGREVAPYRRDYEVDYDYPSRRPQHPSYERRQSSLDTHDRRPLPRYGDQERDINVNLNLQAPAPPPVNYREYDYGSPRQEYHAEEDYRDVSVRRERERSTYRRRDDYDYNYEESPPPRSGYYHRRGRTRMPKRLVHRNAILQMGYPFEEEEFFYIVRVALDKDQIDEVIKISESYFQESSTSINVDETKMITEGPAEPEPEPETNEIVETTTTKIIENPTDEDLEKYSKAGEQSIASNETETQSQSFSKETVKSSSSHSPSQAPSRGRSSKTEIVEEENDTSESNQIVLPERRKERDIKAEIRALEAERRALRESRETRESDEIEIVERSSRDRESERDVVRVEKDSRGGGRFLQPHRSSDRSRSRSRRRPNQKMVNAALFSLT